MMTKARRPTGLDQFKKVSSKADLRDGDGRSSRSPALQFISAILLRDTAMSKGRRNRRAKRSAFYSIQPWWGIDMSTEPATAPRNLTGLGCNRSLSIY